MTGAFLQQLVVAAIVLAAAAYLTVKLVRAVRAARSRRAAACSSGCGCAPAQQPRGGLKAGTRPQR